MNTYVWSDYYSVGHEVIDAQHKELFVALRELQLETYGEVDAAFVVSKIKQLQAYCLHHFSSEKAAFEPYKDRMEFYEAHMAQHEDFVQKTHVFAQRAEVEGGALIEELCEFLSTWLVNHIVHMDKQCFAMIQDLQD